MISRARRGLACSPWFVSVAERATVNGEGVVRDEFVRTGRVDGGAVDFVGAISAAGIGEADPTLLAVLTILALVGTIAVVARYGRTGSTPGSGSSGPSSGADRVADRSDGGETPTAFERQIGRQTLDRLDPLAPERVGRVRDRLREIDDVEGELERVERELREVVAEAVADAAFDPRVRSRYGEEYEVVNLPEAFREVRLVAADEVVHVGDLERAVEDQLEDDATVRDVTRTAAEVRAHCEEIEAYVDRREEPVAELRSNAEETLADATALVERLDGDLGDRVDELLLDGRHSDTTVPDVERRIREATGRLHRCAFDDAQRALREAERDAETLLVTVDFLGALSATLEHRYGSTTIEVPDSVDVDLVAELEPVIERQYGVVFDEADGSLRVERRSGSTASSASTGGNRPQRAQGQRERRTRTGERRRRPEAIADEVLYVFRELAAAADASSRSIECQTEALPSGVVEGDVLDELVAFCERQSDIVAEVNLQDGAPPGFLTVRFDPRTTAESGAETLYERFDEKHG